MWEGVLCARWGVTAEFRAVVPNEGGGGHFAPRGHLAMSEDISIFNWVGGGGGEVRRGQDRIRESSEERPGV